MSDQIRDVRAWEQDVVIPTYLAPPPDKNPMFLDKRVYQGSTGKVYPNAFTDHLSDQKVDQAYKAVFLENQFLLVMILPELGGRIHIGQDKSNGHDFFYRQNVIKPALVGLLGPWISGGVEFNWPQHHRPSTYMPVEHCIEKSDDGAYTVWLSEHEPMNRMKGMVGIRLSPGKSTIEATVRIYNRTPFVQTFLWWANAGIRVHDQYQAFFPPDVTFVADHAKRAMSRYPVARNFYYGIDYSRGVDLSWYKNIPVPTSYMVTRSEYDFFGGYDHSKQAGIVHYANHRIAPGKKLWTWGNAEFGYAWDRELTDSDGPYIELMAGVYTDNQPDFSWLQPYETRTFSQFWYPIKDIGPVKNATRLLAINLEPAGGQWKIGVCATEPLNDLRIVLTNKGQIVFETQVSLTPASPFVEMVSLSTVDEESRIRLSILDASGNELIHYAPQQSASVELPPPAAEPPLPAAVQTIEELYLTGLHLEQYRHATRHPEPYWLEGLNRDPLDSRCNQALGLSALRRGEFGAAVRHLQTAIGRLTTCNPNPRDGEPFYHLGLAHRFASQMDEAYAALYKATWNYAWQSPAHYELAAIDCARGRFESALEHADRSLRNGIDNLKARNLKTAVLRHLRRNEEARVMALETSKIDKLDFWSQNELGLLNGSDHNLIEFLRYDSHNCLDLAFDYAHAGLWVDAAEVIDRFLTDSNNSRVSPMIYYARAYFAQQKGDAAAASTYYERAATASPDYCFPSLLEEMITLQAAIQHCPGDGRAHYYLGNLLYDKLRRQEAIHHWEEATRLDPDFSVSWRNLGIAYYNARGNAAQAQAAYRNAFAANPSDARILYELDQLNKRTGVSPKVRLAELDRYPELVHQRDDLTIELVTLYNQIGHSEQALSILLARRFHPWEGGEGLISGQYVTAHLLLGREALHAGDALSALRHFQLATEYPHTLGGGKHALQPETDIDYFTGIAMSELGRRKDAEEKWRSAASARPELSSFAYYWALARRQLGDEAGAVTAFTALRRAATEQMQAEVKIDYFATSLPNFLIFDDDLEKRNQAACLFVRGLAQFGLGNRSEAINDLRTTLEIDGNHLWAQVELTDIMLQQNQLAQRR
jgi:tetratricopeptide (TPR) repeat protein